MISKELQKIVNITHRGQKIQEITRLDLNQYSITGKKNDINLQDLEEFSGLITLKLKNFVIDEKSIISICKVKNLILKNCVLNLTDKVESNIEYLELINCLNIEHNMLNAGLKTLYLDTIEKIDIDELLKYKELRKLRIENCKNINNMSKIAELTSLEELSLNDIDIQNINIDKMKDLKLLNLNGSRMDNKEIFIEYVKQRNIDIKFADKNLPIE